MFHLRDIEICQNRYTDEERQARGRMRVILSMADPEYPDAKDCKIPNDEEMKKIRNRMNKRLRRSGVICKGVFKVKKGSVDDTVQKTIPFSASVDLWNCYLTEEYTRIYGNNIDPMNGKRTRNLGFYDIVEVASVINDVADELHFDADFSMIDPLTAERIAYPIPCNELHIERLFNTHENKIVFVDKEVGAAKVLENMIIGQADRIYERGGIFVRKEFYLSTKGGRDAYWKGKYPEIKEVEDNADDEEEMQEVDKLRMLRVKKRVIDYGDDDIETLPDIFKDISKKRREVKNDD